MCWKRLLPGWCLLVTFLLGSNQIAAERPAAGGEAADEEPATVHCQIEILRDAIVVELLIREHGQEVLDLQISDWAGRNDYSQSISDLRAYDADGNELQVDFDGLRTWRVPTSQQPFTLTYRVHPTKNSFAGEDTWDFLYPTILESHGLAWGPTFLVLPGDETFKDTRVSLSITAPEHYERVFSNIGQQQQTNLGELRYLFLAWGDYHYRDFPLDGRTVRLIVEAGDWKTSPATLINLASRILVSQANSMGIIPFNEDLLISLTMGSSSVMGGTAVPGAVSLYFDPATELTDHGSLPAYLIAHEFFHLWNGIHLRLFGHMNWFKEGFTDYYAYLTLLREGIVSPDDYLRWFNRAVSAYRQNPFALNTPVEDQGELFWSSDQFRDLVYRKGALIAFLMDRQIRTLTEHRSTLDDLMSVLMTDEKILEEGLTHANLLVALEELTGSAWDNFLEDYVNGTEPLPVEEFESAEDLLSHISTSI